ncbi:BZ3500_MvSof-1268-A1-R1_Chr8-2g10187 [Microbotryum saponariae]|uniref:BZ3500_MvSof-1268-A1-R1_Chr8-2g10187 protein n=1 Tax=Microbotryum saponariae TaxID=289078 RepID=A0A2X0KVK3_9BASI|nr:BZ3500_MvSof-1268-A1-R1_Chr8-2g10187 [Microbotryum saponariae]SDA01961.1 BZ3501_MvSof-1269-A2-R1_Chr8-2g09937 [Microbotryum saponariae]
MATTDALLSLSSRSVVVHPLVLLSIQDHLARVAKGTHKRVVGILLGQDKPGAGRINVANSFAVPFEEDDKDPRTWFLDHNYIEAMNDMFKKVNASEKLIGWYHTGPKLRSSDLEINQVIKRYTPKPVMVIVDVRPDSERAGGVGIPTDAYFAVEEIKDDGTATQQTFLHVPSSIEAEEAEEIGVEHLLRDIKNLSVGTLSSRVSDQLSSLRGLQSRLNEIKDYLQAVVDGVLPVNHQIIYNLQDMFNLLPNVDAAETAGQGEAGTRRPFTVATNDQLLVMYLSSLIRAVIALHDLVLNKQAAASEQKGDANDDDTPELTEEEKKKAEEKAKQDAKSDSQKAREWFGGGKEDKGEGDMENQKGGKGEKDGKGL